MTENYRKAAELKEENLLCKSAAFSKDHSRFFGRDDDHRLPYKRDVDRIVHSKAYARYADKTQVVYLVDNDHISHRSLHVQLVSHFARGIGEVLHLNLNLIEAIALGHDVGHPPFGHEGEGYLSELSLEHGNGPFSHPVQSCRLLTEIEPLNLGLAVYDGFLSHDGAMNGTLLKPAYGKNWDGHCKDKKLKTENPDANIIPATLEGCLVKLCDTVSYVARDIEDAISIGIIDRKEIPRTHLGHTSSQILNAFATDVIRQSYGQDFIAVSEEGFAALKTLRDFNFDRIYHNPKLKVESHKVKQGYRILFDLLLEDLHKHKAESYLWTHFASNKPASYLASATHPQLVVDYISGMTDNYFVRTLEAFAIPKRIKI